MSNILIISQCPDGAVTHPKLDAFSDAVSADQWHHIMLPEMEHSDFLVLMSQIHSLVVKAASERLAHVE